MLTVECRTHQLYNALFRVALSETDEDIKIRRIDWMITTKRSLSALIKLVSRKAGIMKVKECFVLTNYREVCGRIVGQPTNPRSPACDD